MIVEESKFTATADKGPVSAILMRPEHASHLLVLGHGASTNMRHATMESIAGELARAGVATFRYNFPYSENGTARNSAATCVETVRNAAKAARDAAPELVLLAGGHSFGGRMTTTAQSEEPLAGVNGLVLFSFPLHMPGRPDTKRAEHLAKIDIPMLFLSGTRDDLAERHLLEPVVAGQPGAALHLLETANHGYKILKKTRTNPKDVFAEIAETAAAWANGLQA